MRPRLVAGNWKMNRGGRDAADLARAARDALLRQPAAPAVLCPPFTALAAVGEVLTGSGVAVGAQDCHWAPAGAYTGEVSAAMLAELGCSYVIVGHSERRHGMGETDRMVALKVAAALGAGLTPILCVGETATERQAGGTEARVSTQVESALASLGATERGLCVVAYEPVWAIGSGTPATASDAAAVARLVRRLAGAEVRVLYGGSVNPANCAAFWTAGECDGALVGGASLDPAAFGAIVAEAGR